RQAQYPSAGLFPGINIEAKLLSFFPIFCLKHYESGSSHTKYQVDRLWHSVIIPTDLNPMQRVEKIIEIYRSLDSEAMAAFSHMMEDKRRYRTYLKRFHNIAQYVFLYNYIRFMKCIESKS